VVTVGASRAGKASNVTPVSATLDLSVRAHRLEARLCGAGQHAGRDQVRAPRALARVGPEKGSAYRVQLAERFLALEGTAAAR